MVEFNSSAICWGDYDPVARVLRLQFTSGSKIYDFPGVPEQIWIGLLNAVSKGTYYDQQIRDVYVE